MYIKRMMTCDVEKKFVERTLEYVEKSGMTVSNILDATAMVIRHMNDNATLEKSQYLRERGGDVRVLKKTYQELVLIRKELQAIRRSLEFFSKRDVEKVSEQIATKLKNAASNFPVP